MKLYPNIQKAILKIISETISEKKVLDRTLQSHFKKNKQWGARDRRALAQCCYDIIRHYELLIHLSPTPSDIIDTYLGLLTDDGLWIMETIVDRYQDTIPFEILYSVPDDLLKLVSKYRIKNFEDNWKAMHQKAPIYLRINQSQTTTEAFLNAMDTHNIGYQYENKEWTIGRESINTDVIKLDKPLVSQSEFAVRHASQYEIQDIGSQLLTHLCGSLDHMQVLEGCAGQGGKTTHLLDLNPKINLVSMDIDPKKIAHLISRVSRMYGKRVVALKTTPENILKYENWADALMLDVPCTGFGTLSRQPDIKYRITEKYLLEKVDLQRRVIVQYLSTLKVKAKVFYSTCSLFEVENKAQLDILYAHGFDLVSEVTLEPKDYDGDGFYWAKLER